ncbi:CoA-dependent acyltransferase [Multifurca ochricompacta]|uniref:Dihydrolipoamide acetyltransferase component of pyruvate dehydrogenase complex n=1 Tax=Multifurca ochricompacta TaxID=376703 RepID=A0AAD4QJN3_9AGAM|nr:CoA-dependent acyltransferase [Multifurca ochricompacta]
MSLLRQTRCVISRRRQVAYLHVSPAWWATRKVLQQFKLADIGEGITECEIIKWSVSPQSLIGAFEPLCEVQSDKASVEITSPYDGTVKEILVQEGQVAKVGDGLCVIEVDEEASDSSDVPTSESPDASTNAANPSQQHQAPERASEQLERSVVVEVQPAAAEKPSVARPPHPLNSNELASTASWSGDSAGTIVDKKATEVEVLVLPAVRYFARQSGVDISLLAPGSGKNGRVERIDVERYLAGGKSAASEQPSAALAPPPAEEDVVVELGRTRYGMWKAMEKSLEIPHFGYSTSLDLTTLHTILPILNANIPQHYLPPSQKPSTPPAASPSSFFPVPAPPVPPASGTYDKLTYLPVLLKTLSKAMHSWPIFRSSITPGIVSSGSKPTLTVRPHSDISIALSTPTGLYTPTVRAVDNHSVYSLASTLKHLAHLGRQDPSGLTPTELPRRGGTLTVSNVGAIGAGESAMPVLVPGGGVAIVALGRARWVWDVERGDGKGERRLKLGISWSADHRVIEGAELAAFVETWRGYVEQPERMIAEGV